MSIVEDNEATDQRESEGYLLLPLTDKSPIKPGSGGGGRRSRLICSLAGRSTESASARATTERSRRSLVGRSK